MLPRFEGQIQLVFYPFVLSPTSNVATQAALCAGEQGKFWDFHHLLYERQAQWHRLDDPLSQLLAFAADVGVEAAALRSCVENGRMQALIDADRDYGRSLQVRSTPTLFINDKRLVGAPEEADLVRVIREELASAQRSAN